MSMRQSQNQRQNQSLSPQQIQLMQLIQLPTYLMEQRIKEEIEENPVLQEGDEEETRHDEIDAKKDSDDEYDDFGDFSEREVTDLKESFDNMDYLSTYMTSDDAPSYAYNTDHHDHDEEQKTIPIPTVSSFHEFLDEQLGLLNIEDERTLKVAKQIIGSIDEDGYLRRETFEIVDDMIFYQNITSTVEEVEMLLSKIQRFDPPGIGCRNLQECLYLQLLNYLEQTDKKSEAYEIIENCINIVLNYFDEFCKKHYPRLQRSLGLNEKQLKLANDFIKSLNPKPASGYTNNFNNGGISYIIPDFTISNREGQLELDLNSRNEPELRISEQYKDMFQEFKNNEKVTRTQRDTMQFLRQKIDSAKWFIDAIKQRNETMLNTMYAIMKYQQQFFLTGDEKRLRPMILKDIAQMTNLDISTISRVANSKYVQTEFGTRKLKDFFSESLMTDEGDEVSTLEVKNILLEIIKEESKRKPHSDEKLKILLQKKGYNIARRTVAKYREQLSIPVARMRKAL